MPVLFILYLGLNDLVEYSDSGSDLYLYANDDAKVLGHRLPIDFYAA